jgi:DNA-binding NarL/FixJ family response regulator
MRKTANKSKVDSHAVEVEARRQQVLNLRRSGFSIRAIATQLNISVGQAHTDIKEALEALQAQTIEIGASYRELELERIDRMLVALDAQVKKGDTQAVNTSAKLIDMRAKLLGLYAPAKQEITGANGGVLEIRIVEE